MSDTTAHADATAIGSHGQGPLAEALAAAPPELAIGFVTAPAAAFFVRRSGATLEGKGVTPDVDWIYDCRLFGADAEWHWWWDQAARAGRWSLLDDSTAAARGWTPQTPQPPERRLLRGTVHEVDGDWALTHDGHSRPLWVPVVAARGDRLMITAVEYVCAPDPLHGNVGVVTERLGTIGVLTTT